MEDYDPEQRCAPAPGDFVPVRSVEINFAIPVWVCDDDQRRLHDLLREIVARLFNQPRAGVHWLSEAGCKVKWSQADAMLLGVTDPGAVSESESGEPEYDETILSFGTTARGFVSDEERERKNKWRRTA